MLEKKEQIKITEHKQLSLSPEFDTENQNINQDRSQQRRDFELSAPNILRTDKDLNIKNKFQALENETVLGHGQKVKLREIISGDDPTYNMTLSDYIVAISDVAIARTIQLPKPSIAGFGKLYVIKDSSGSAAATTISITPFDTDLIDGQPGASINSDFGSLKIYTNGTDWFTESDNAKKSSRRIGSTASSATPTINTDLYDVYRLTAQAAAITSFTTNLSGSPSHDDALIIEITDNGTARAITWGASFEASTVALPTTTVISTLLRVGFLYNSATSKWTCVAVA